jgi:hypothetical protein
VVIGITSSSPRPIIAFPGAFNNSTKASCSIFLNLISPSFQKNIDNPAFFSIYVSKSTNGTFMVFDSS